MLKNSLHKNKKKNHLSFKESDESRHAYRKIKTHIQQKANNAIDKALKQKKLKDVYDMEDLY